MGIDVTGLKDVLEVITNKEVQAVVRMLLELADDMAEIELAPRLREVSRFMTQQDIDAIAQMVDAGMTQEQAVALRCAHLAALQDCLRSGR